MEIKPSFLLAEPEACETGDEFFIAIHYKPLAICVSALAASTDCAHTGAEGRSTLFTALARRSAHLVQFGSFVFKQPKWRPYQQAPFSTVVTLVAITFISDPNSAGSFHKAA
jgi:hypothetical protein